MRNNNVGRYSMLGHLAQTVHKAIRLADMVGAPLPYMTAVPGRVLDGVFTRLPCVSYTHRVYNPKQKGANHSLTCLFSLPGHFLLKSFLLQSVFAVIAITTFIPNLVLDLLDNTYQSFLNALDKGVTWLANRAKINGCLLKPEEGKEAKEAKEAKAHSPQTKAYYAGKFVVGAPLYWVVAIPSFILSSLLRAFVGETGCGYAFLPRVAYEFGGSIAGVVFECLAVLMLGIKLVPDILFRGYNCVRNGLDAAVAFSVALEGHNQGGNKQDGFLEKSCHLLGPEILARAVLYKPDLGVRAKQQSCFSKFMGGGVTPASWANFFESYAFVPTANVKEVNSPI